MTPPAERFPLSLLGTFALVLAGLFWYSQTSAYAWDEGFHLITAQLISRGKTPYLDFFFPQTPYNAYWNAFWMHIFGDTWRTAHGVAACITAFTALLVGDFALRRFGSRLVAVATMLLFAGNAMVVQFGPVGQAYGLCLFLLVAAFRLVVFAAENGALWAAFAAGFLSAASACASLLTLPAAPVMWVWLLFQNGPGSKVRRAAAFATGCLLSVSPVLWLYAKDPFRVLFNVLLYNMRYRAVGWDNDVRQHDFEVLLAAIDSSQALVLGLGALGALWFLWKSQDWMPVAKAPFYLCGLLAAALAIHMATAGPTFDRYFLFLTPWLAMLTGAAFTLINPQYRRGAIGVALVLTALGLAKSLYAEREAFTWSVWEQVAHKVDEVTPPGLPVQADEHVYLITRRTPPEGMEHENSHKPMPISAQDRRRLHILSKPEMEEQIRRGAYATIATCDEDKPVARSIIAPLYQHTWELEQCTVYWGFKKPTAAQ